MITTSARNYCSESTGIFQWPVCKATPVFYPWCPRHFSDIKMKHRKKCCNQLMKQEVVIVSERFTVLNGCHISSTCQVRSSNTHASFKSSLKSHLFRISYCVCVCVPVFGGLFWLCLVSLLCNIRGYICSISEKWHIKEYIIISRYKKKIFFKWKHFFLLWLCSIDKNRHSNWSSNFCSICFLLLFLCLVILFCFGCFPAVLVSDYTGIETSQHIKIKCQQTPLLFFLVQRLSVITETNAPPIGFALGALSTFIITVWGCCLTTFYKWTKVKNLQTLSPPPPLFFFFPSSSRNITLAVQIGLKSDCFLCTTVCTTEVPAALLVTEWTEAMRCEG